MSGTKVTDAGLKHLRTLPCLRELVLFGTDITDAGLTQIAGMAELKRVVLQRTKVTDAGASWLRKKLPKCEVAN